MNNSEVDLMRMRGRRDSELCNYAYTEKIKSYQALSEREKHNTRCKTVLSSDGTKNIEVKGKRGLVSYVKKLEKEVDSRNKRKTRKDAVRTIEVLFTSDKAFFKRVDYNQYFDRCKE